MPTLLMKIPTYLYRSPFDLEGIGITLPDVPNHPNASPFTAVLTRIEEPSTRAPNGASGHRVSLTRQAVETALPSLIGMGVDCSEDFSSHDKQNKIGIITEAHIEGKDLVISGHLFEKDFPQEVAYIRQHKDKIGASYEIASVEVESEQAPIWTITGLVFTGAALLFKDKAAYAKTSVLASMEASTVAVLDDFRESVYLLHLHSLRARVARLCRRHIFRRITHG